MEIARICLRDDRCLNNVDLNARREEERDGQNNKGRTTEEELKSAGLARRGELKLKKTGEILCEL